jgi:hypothetical protein
MLVFLDTEFTDLGEPNLLSVGMVSEAGDELYVELELDTDDARDRMRVTSAFVDEVVLPQWSRVPGAACSHREMGRRIGEWLQRLAERSGQVELVSDCRLDVELVEGALGHAGLLQAMNAVSTQRIVAGVDEIGDVGRLYGRAERRRLYRHHALADAMALRSAHEPAETIAAEFGGLAGAISRGEQAKREWVRNGEVVPIEGLVQAWGLTVDAIDQAERDGELFSVSIGGHRYVPSEFMRLSRADVSAVCRELHPWLTAVEELFFFRKKHGALGGKTAFEAIESDKDGSQVIALVNLARAATAQNRAQSSQDQARCNALALRAAYIGNRAAIELSAMRARLGITEETAQAAIEDLAAGSENVKAAWIQDGLIIGGEQLAMAWSCSPQAVELACERGELCNLNFRGHNWYPADAASVSAADVGQVTAALQPLDGASQVIFWARRHGSLGGLTAAQAIAAGNLAGVLRMARVLVYESL